MQIWRVLNKFGSSPDDIGNTKHVLHDVSKKQTLDFQISSLFFPSFLQQIFSIESKEVKELISNKS